jgi:tRNA threonylcarbamoyl adenosine modification protein YeaZ
VIRKTVIAIETSTPQASVAWLDAAGLLAEESFSSDRSHNSGVFGPLGRALEGCEPGGVGILLVGTGPGSYSGVRIGIAAAQGLGMVHGCAVAGVPSMLGTAAARAGGRWLAVGDARRGLWYVAVVADGRLEAAPELLDADGFGARVAAGFAAGEGVFSLDEVGQLGLEAGLAGRVVREWPRAAHVLEAWESWDEVERARWLGEAPQPVYLREAFISVAKRGHPLKRG